jgi:hypothetical protein
MITLILSVVIGVSTNLVAWWMIARGLIPKIMLSPQISKIPETRRNAQWRYRVKIANRRRWFLPRRRVVNVSVNASLQVHGLDPEAPYNLTNYKIPVTGDGAIPLIMDNHVVRFRTEEMDLGDAPLLVSHLHPNGPQLFDLEQLLQLGDWARIRVMVTASDAYTNATTTRIADYVSDSIVGGRFSNKNGKVGLQIVKKSITNDDQEKAKTDSSVAQD